jgi:hypothetical protein
MSYSEEMGDELNGWWVVVAVMTLGLAIVILFG